MPWLVYIIMIILGDNCYAMASSYYNDHFKDYYYDHS